MAECAIEIRGAQMMDEVKYEIKSGMVLINSLTVVTKSPSCIVIEADLKTKYASIFGQSGNCTIMLDADDDTLHFDETTTEPTELKIILPDEWTIFSSDVARYTLRMVLINYSKCEGYQNVAF